jgi:hypothetical protein
MTVPESSASSEPLRHRCSFCDKDQAQVEKLVMMGAKGICGDCIMLLSDAIDENPRRGEERYDRVGVLQAMAATAEYVMVRRPTERPFVIDRKDWESLASTALAAPYADDPSGVGSFGLPLHRIDGGVRQRGLSPIPTRR